MEKHDKTIELSSEEFARNENKALRKKLAEKDAELAFANETIGNLQKMCSKMSISISEVEAERDENAEKIVRLQMAMGKMSEEIYGV